MLLIEDDEPLPRLADYPGRCGRHWAGDRRPRLAAVVSALPARGRGRSRLAAPRPRPRRRLDGGEVHCPSRRPRTVAERHALSCRQRSGFVGRADGPGQRGRRPSRLRFPLSGHRLDHGRRRRRHRDGALHKEGLYAAGIHHPGHTEILAERTGVREFAMVLAVEGLAVAHVTLHMALRDVFCSSDDRRRCGKGASLGRSFIAVIRAKAAARRGGAESTRQRRRSCSATKRSASSRRPSGKRKPRGWTYRDRGRAIRCLCAPAKGRSTASWRCTMTRGTSR